LEGISENMRRKALFSIGTLLGERLFYNRIGERLFSNMSKRVVSEWVWYSWYDYELCTRGYGYEYDYHYYEYA
jgi:hypothetical protein